MDVVQLNAALLDRYTVDRQIGAGGMATVFLARDLRHDRPVALKVLNPELGAVLGVERFLSEIRLTANLQHPHLLPLFDSGEADGLLFYVMPYIEGETLRARLAREKQLPVDDAVRIAIAIAGALDYAHRHGVIHRDLKPENILMHEGEALVADFGIALAVSNAGGNRITQTGLSLGTPQYMSPEQATGDRAIDGRTDIYSLGVVLYEMLAGDPPYLGSTAQAVIARVLTETPRLLHIARPAVPANVEAAVARALEKLPADRYSRAQEFIDALRAPSATTTRSSVAELVPRGATRRLIAPIVVAAAIGAVAATAVTARMLHRGDTAPESVSFIVQPPVNHGVSEFLYQVAISPDGRMLGMIAYEDSTAKVFVRSLGDATLRAVPGTDGTANVAFSPDGRRLALLQGSQLRVMGTDGSSPLTVASGVDFAGGLTWIDDHRVLLGSHGATVGLTEFSTDGAAPSAVFKVAPTFEHGLPMVDGDHNTVAFMDWGPGYTEDDYLAIGSLSTRAYVRTRILAVAPLAFDGDRVVYTTAGGAIMSVAFDRHTHAVTGSPTHLADIPPPAQVAVGMSATGTLAYSQGSFGERLVIGDSSGFHAISSDVREMVASAPGSALRLSPDGRRAAVGVFLQRADSSSSDVWTVDMSSGVATPLTHRGDVVGPDWTPDGRHIVFSTWFNKSPTILIASADGSDQPRAVVRLPDAHGITGAAVTPDGMGVVYCDGVFYASPAIWYAPFDGSSVPVQIMPPGEPAANFCSARVSPDGKWLAYVAGDGGKTNVFVRPFRSPGGRVRISPDGGADPLWSRDGTRVFYRRSEPFASFGEISAATVRVTGGTLAVAGRRVVLPMQDSPLYDVTADGRHVLTVKTLTDSLRVVVTTQWLQTVARRSK